MSVLLVRDAVENVYKYKFSQAGCFMREKSIFRLVWVCCDFIGFIKCKFCLGLRLKLKIILIDASQIIQAIKIADVLWTERRCLILSRCNVAAVTCREAPPTLAGLPRYKAICPGIDGKPYSIRGTEGNLCPTTLFWLPLPKRLAWRFETFGCNLELIGASSVKIWRK